MQIFNSQNYIHSLRKHYEIYYGQAGKEVKLENDPLKKLHPGFFILEITPNEKHNMFCYCTVGMSIDRIDENLIELIIYSPKPDKSIIELLTYAASYHRNKLPLNINHTINIGQSWLDNSKCDHVFISLPYLDGDKLEIFKIDEEEIHCYWLIPITEKERDYKIENGCQALEQLFEDKQIDYLNPNRESLVS